MTHDEIAQLDAAQLRLEVAKAKGYIDNRQFCENEFLGPDNEWYYLESEYSSDRILPNWPADIAAAMGLIVEMRDAGYLVIVKAWPVENWQFSSPALKEFLRGRVSVEVMSKQADNEVYFHGGGTTIEEAACRAYLMLKQG